MQRDRHGENDDHQEGKGGETKLLRRGPYVVNFISVDGTPTRYLGTTFLPRSERSFRKQSKLNGKEYSILKASRS